MRRFEFTFGLGCEFVAAAIMFLAPQHRWIGYIFLVLGICLMLCPVISWMSKRRKPDRKTMMLLATFSVFLLGTIVTGSMLLHRTWHSRPALVFVFAPPWPLREGKTIPGSLDTQPIPFGVRNTTGERLEGVSVKWMSSQQSGQRGFDALNRPLKSVDGLESVSINPGDTVEFIFADYVIAKDGTRSVHLPIENMNIRPGHGPDREGFPITYLIGMQVGSETSPITHGRFTLIITEEGWSFAPESTEKSHLSIKQKAQ